MAGFVFVPLLGSVATLLVISAVYVLAAAICFALGGLTRRGQGVAALGAIAVGLTGIAATGLPAVCDRESSYYCIRTVALSEDPRDPVNLMVIDHLAHGISSERDPRLMYTEHAAMLDVLPRMRMGRRDFTSFHIGGGSYSVPRAWADRGITGITIAEIDPEVTRIAAESYWFDPATATIRVTSGSISR